MDRTLIIAVAVVVAALLGLFLIMKPSLTPPTPSTPVASINSVTVVAHDYSFDAPDVIPAGITSFELLNQGQEMHHITLFRLEGGHTMTDLEATMQAPPSGPLDWLVAVGGPNAAIPGGSANATLDLQPGSYAMLCLIPAADGVPHFAKGMVWALTVAPSQGAKAAEPKADVTIELADYSFTLSKPITAGSHTIKAVNRGPQDHEVVIFKLAPGKTPEDVMAAGEDIANFPGEFWGGVSTMGGGQSNYTTLHFTPGNYLLLCYVPDVADGAPHIAHGMMQMITVN